MASLFDDPGLRRGGRDPGRRGRRGASCWPSWHKAKTAHFKELVADGADPAAARHRAASSRRRCDAGWTVAVASTSAEESVRAVLEHAVGDETAADGSRCSPATSSRPRSRTRRSTS